jgi:dihydrolipoamide dehydrogenase
MDTKHYDLIVFGGGNAISTAIQCGAKGLKVAAVEKGPLGGTCPHRGCIPSKLLIGYADAAENARDARRFGFETTVRTTDPDAILRNTFDFTKKYDSILEKALGKNVTLYRNRYLAASVPFMNTTKGRAVKEEHGLCKTTHCARPQNPGLPYRRLSGFRAPARRHTEQGIRIWTN